MSPSGYVCIPSEAAKETREGWDIKWEERRERIQTMAFITQNPTSCPESDLFRFTSGSAPGYLDVSLGRTQQDPCCHLPTVWMTPGSREEQSLRQTNGSEKTSMIYHDSGQSQLCEVRNTGT